MSLAPPRHELFCGLLKLKDSSVSGIHRADPNATPPRRARARARAVSLYSALLREGGGGPGQIDELARSASRSFLLDQIDATSELACDFPDHIRSLPVWLEQENREAAERYRQYLDERQAGAPRRFFSTRSHALHFLRAVAPTKLVDGAWLYGLLPHWNDARFGALIRIYLDELGQGRRAQNHVALYRDLLSSHGLEGHGAERLADEHYTQGAIQLALAHHADEFLPELIGFNLGYEQLPLHLPITAYELAELDIDPYYFTLHVTVDNGASGHARQALDGLLAAWPRLGSGREFFARVAAGFKLNLLGMGTVDAIESFDLERELLGVLANKAMVGAPLHSDYCSVGGKTVTEWLSEPARLPDFLRALEDLGWIRRGQPPVNSRFWRLLHDEGSPMFGVFTAWEQALVADWIVAAPGAATLGSPPPPPLPRRPARRFPKRVVAPAANAVSRPPRPAHGTTVADVLSHHLAGLDRATAGDFNADLRLLSDRLAGVTGRAEAMARLIGLLSPANHSSPVGLLATRIYTNLRDAHE
ncbi:MAG: iron-containing redox enzyme family protein [Methylibium sp.]|nr:iron-containing redox enzyme family protein [Methylibium sp.]